MVERRQAPERPADDAPRSASGIDKDRYKAEVGKQDLVAIVCKPRWTPKHYTGKFYLQCLQEAEAPCCEFFGPPSPSSTAYVIHVASRKGSGKWTMIGQPKVWGFGEDKWIQYQTLLRDFCDGDFKKLQRMLISVTCQDTEKQKLYLTEYPKDDVKLTGEMFALAKEKREMFEDDIAIDREDVVHTIAKLSGGHGKGDTTPSPERDVEVEPDQGPDLDSESVDDQIGQVIADWQE